MTILVPVGMGRFELPAPRPPDEYSNRTELHPELGVLGLGYILRPYFPYPKTASPKEGGQIYKDSFNSNKKACNFNKVSRTCSSRSMLLESWRNRSLAPLMVYLRTLRR